VTLFGRRKSTVFTYPSYFNQKPCRPYVPSWGGDILRTPRGSVEVKSRWLQGITQPSRLTCWARSADIPPQGPYPAHVVHRGCPGGAPLPRCRAVGIRL
jgi:hypothetical protein